MELFWSRKSCVRRLYQGAFLVLYQIFELAFEAV